MISYKSSGEYNQMDNLKRELFYHGMLLNQTVVKVFKKWITTVL